MPLPDHVTRFWRALDDRFGRVEPTWWGAVVTDARYPAIWDANYARIDVAGDDLTATDVEAELLPALGDVGTRIMHVVSFDPEATGPLLAELSTRGHRLTFDLVMDLVDRPAEPASEEIAVEELPRDAIPWERVAASFGLFGVEGPDEVAQLRDIERDVLVPSGKRWFAVRDEGGDAVSVGAVIVLEGVAYLDNIATFPGSRGRGLATAIASRMIDEAFAAGAAHACLFADPDAREIVRMYERLGFRGVGRLASTRGPIPSV